ncbi:MFS transporter [Sphingobium sp. Ant17]|uniref:MFS transporter n=1 Tax=Sphingobium sp. Ant17 TaxID=1461752 RepID=UPI0004B41E75|nr:MFS transporter [Sphingobium sp. Ant17]
MAQGELNFKSGSAAFAALTGNFVCSAPIVTASFGAFLIPVTTEYGWSRSSFSFVLTLVSLIGVVMLPFAGRMADRFGVRRVVLLGNLAFAVSIALLALCGGRLTDFYIAYVLVAVTSAFSSTVLLSRVVSVWFANMRGLFLGLTAGIGNGMGCAFMPILALMVIERLGWRDAYLALGGAVAVIGFPIMYFALREPNASPTLAIADPKLVAGISAREARQSPLFWLILVTIAVGGGALSAVFTHVVPLLADRGLGGSAMLVITCIAFSSTLSQVTLGRILDKASLPRFAAVLILMSAVGIAVLARAVTTPALVTAGILIGIGNGAEYALLSYVIPRYFGFRSYSEIYGSILGVVLLFMGTTPMLMDVVFDVYGNYGLSLVGIAGALLVTTILILRFPSYRYTRTGNISGPTAPVAPLAALPT